MIIKENLQGLTCPKHIKQKNKTKTQNKKRRERERRRKKDHIKFSEACPKETLLAATNAPSLITGGPSCGPPACEIKA